MDTAWTFAKVVLGLEAVVLCHLLGHFVAAKILRVPLHLRLGLGPALPGCRFARGRDAFVLAWFPLGGYLSVARPASGGGEIPAVWKRLLVAGGGVVANVLLAWVCFTLWLSHGTERVPAVVGDVAAGSAAWTKGIPSGAVIQQIDDMQNPFFDDLMLRVMTTSLDEKLQLVYTAPGNNAPVTVAVAPRSEPKQLRPILGIGVASIPRLVARRYSGNLAGPVCPNSAADRAEPRFAFDDVIAGTTDPDHPDRIEPLPEDPRNPGSGNRDYFEWLRRLRRLAGKDMIVRVQRGDGPDEDIHLPPAFHVTLPMRMDMGPIAALRAGSPGERVLRPADPSQPAGDHIVAVEVDEPDGSTTTLRGKSLDPLRLPYQLRQWSWRMARTGKGDSRVVTLTVHRAEPGQPVGELVTRLPWNASWEDQHDISSGSDAPLSIPELGIAYYVTTRVAAVIDGPVDRPQVALQPGDVIEAIRFSADPKRVDLPFHGWASAFASLQRAPTGEITVDFARGDLRRTLVLTADEDPTWPRDDRGLILARDTRMVRADNLLDAGIEGWRYMGKAIAQITSKLWSGIAGRIESRKLGGPVAIQATRIADADWISFIWFLGTISLNFCWVNLLPVPILDGGEVVLLAVEKCKGHPLASRTRRVAYIVGAALMSAWLLCSVLASF